MGSSELLYLVFITLLPWIELRGSIPYGIFIAGLDPFLVLAIAVIVNILLGISTFWVLDFVFPFFESKAFVKKRLEKLRSKAKPLVDKYGFFGLMFFVAIPFPGTGAYSGVLVAKILAMNRSKAFLSIALGVLIAGIIVFLLSTLFGLFVPKL